MDRLEKQYKINKARFQGMSIQNRDLFALMALERQWKVYERANMAYGWGTQEFYRSILDQCWDIILYGFTLENLWKEYKAFHKNALNPKWKDKMDNIYILCTIFLDNLDSLIKNLDSNSNMESFAHLNFEFLKVFLYDYLELKNDEESFYIFQGHELVIAEIQHQNRDYEIIRKMDYVQRMRERYLNNWSKSILGDYWFKKRPLSS